MKKIIALLVIIGSLMTLTSCGEKEYPPVASTDEEKRVVMTVSYDGEDYDIKYELYRAFFLASKSEIDGGDESVWSGANKEEYIAEIDSVIKDKISEIYSVLHTAKKIGINIYSNEYDKTVEETIKLSVEGGNYGDMEIEGYGGSYEKYLAYLKENGINYSVQDLLIRYYTASEEIYRHYAGNLNTEDHLGNIVSGEFKYTEEDVYAFYNSTDCVRVIRAFLPKKYYKKERAEEIRLKIIEKSMKGESDVAEYIISTSTAGATDIKNGDIIAKHNLDAAYKDLVKVAFALSMFDVSNVIEIDNGYEDGYIIMYKTVKNSSHFEECYDQIVGIYLQNRVGEIIDTAATSIKDGLTPTSILEELDRSQISMN